MMTEKWVSVEPGEEAVGMLYVAPTQYSAEGTTLVTADHGHLT
jgi:hypothetical protein